MSSICFIPYIEDSVLRFVSHGFRFILEQWRPTTVRQRLEDPHSLTALHLTGFPRVLKKS